MKLKSGVGKDKYDSVTKLIDKICDNICSNPTDDKFWWVKLSNKKVKELKLWDNKASKAVLDFLGFIEATNSEGE